MGTELRVSERGVIKLVKEAGPPAVLSLIEDIRLHGDLTEEECDLAAKIAKQAACEHEWKDITTYDDMKSLQYGQSRALCIRCNEQRTVDEPAAIRARFGGILE